MNLSHFSTRKLECRVQTKAARWLIPAVGISAFLLSSTLVAATTKSPEQDTLEIAKKLKPIPDEEWQKIAGDHMQEKYEVAKGDTLWDVSKRLFGDPRYWPKVWALNNGGILNPHQIFPGHAVNFQPGTGTSLPGVTVADAESGGEGPGESAGPGGTPTTTILDDGEGTHHFRSQDWKKLPPQPWESVQLTLPPEVDPLGFDRRSRVKSAGPQGFDLPLMVATQKIQPLGIIFAGEKESSFITLQELVFIHPEGDMHIGDIFSITELPDKVTNQATEREGWVYPLLGKVKIVQQREGMFIGLVINVKHIIERGAMIVANVPKVPEMVPIAGPNPTEGVVLLDPQYSTSTTSQHKFVFIDRGTEDGVTPGMIFRSYQKIDPNDAKRATRANSMITADTMIVQTSPKFSTGLVISGFTYFTEGTNAFLLTDVSDLLRRHGPDYLRLDQNGIVPTDELDNLDNGVGLGDKDKRELKQLENWKENPAPAPSGEPLPSPEATPTAEPKMDELPPPPGGELPPPPTAPEPQGLNDIPPPPPLEPQSALPPPPPAAAPEAAPPIAPPPSAPATEPGIGELPPPPPPPPAD